MDEMKLDRRDPWYMPDPLDVCPVELREDFTPQSWAEVVAEMNASAAEVDAYFARERAERKLAKREAAAERRSKSQGCSSS